ncbi:MAG: NuoI/complex I 23 kDa subunit family protein [Solirubrobacterales bacterium]
MAVEEDVRQAPERGVSSGLGLVKGLAVTMKYLLHRSVTQQYPEVKPDLPPRSRGVIALKQENCTVCYKCSRECPDWCIYIDAHKETHPPASGGKARSVKVLDRFAIDYALCMYCGICVEVCPFDALFWSPEFEYATDEIAELTHEKEKLEEWTYTVLPPPALEVGAEPPAEIAAATAPPVVAPADVTPGIAALAAPAGAAPSAPPAPVAAAAPSAPGAAPAAATPAPAAVAAPGAPAEKVEAAIDQETYDRVFAELIGKGTAERVAQGQARRAAMIAARQKAAGGEAAAPAAAAPEAAAPEAPAAAEAPAPAAEVPAATEAEAPAAAEAPVAAPVPVAPAAPAEKVEVSIDQETYDRVFAELIAKGTAERVAQGQARRAAMIAARKKAAGEA